MYILGINGSPRVGGNSDILLERVLGAAKDKGAKTEKIILNKLNFSGCQECSDMPDDGSCKINDDMQSVYKKIAEADVIILAVPIFFGSLSAQAKKMIDRFQCSWRAKYMLKRETAFDKKKRGVFISTEGSTREDFFSNAKSIVQNFFATINIDYFGELFCPGVDEKAGILKHPSILRKAEELGQRVVSD
jgi:multimeric flavodoxin WrbA